MKTHAYDDDGNEIFIVTVIIISPMKYINEAVSASSKYMKNIENVIDWQPEQMLPTALSFTGENPPTHRICCRRIYDNQIPMMVAARCDVDWCADREYTLEDDVINHFCVIRCSVEQLLQKTGLKKIG